jgi:hypothetical protein
MNCLRKPERLKIFPGNDLYAKENALVEQKNTFFNSTVVALYHRTAKISII